MPSTFEKASKTSAEEFDRLLEVCNPTTFGLIDQDVLDLTFRRAGKLDKCHFASNLKIGQLQIVGRSPTKSSPSSRQCKFFCFSFLFRLAGTSKIRLEMFVQLLTVVSSSLYSQLPVEGEFFLHSS